MNVARVNMSHGDHEAHRETIDLFRKVRDEMKLAAAVLIDTKGPEIRLGDFVNGTVTIQKDETFTFTTDNVLGNEKLAHVTYDKLPEDLEKGDYILVNDGLIRFRVDEISGNNIICTAETDGVLYNHKGVNVPNKVLSMPFLSDADKADMLFAIEEKVEYVAASFTRRAEDIKALRAFLEENGGANIDIIAKIENAEGISNLEEILKVADGIMIARGDMGVEIEFERIPGIQKHLIKRAREEGKVVITATQMLESMINNPVPTRAEITDIANAVFEGTSAVMLSGETASGKYPVEAMETMNRIILQSENDYEDYRENRDIVLNVDRRNVTNAVGHGACTIAKDINAKALMAITSSGYTAVKMAKFRPKHMIIGATPSTEAFHKMSLNWGVVPLMTEKHKEMSPENLYRHCLDKALEAGLIAKNDLIVFTMGFPTGKAGNTNEIRVEKA